MTISVDWANKLVLSDASILDAAVCHQSLRALEADPANLVYDVIHKWKALDLGGGAFFYQIDLINGYQWKFPTPGSYTMIGNINGPIVPVAGVYVERKTSAAFATTSVGGTGPSAADIAAAVLAAMNTTPPAVDAKKMNGAVIIGTGTDGDPWRGIGVQP